MLAAALADLKTTLGPLWPFRWFALFGVVVAIVVVIKELFGHRRSSSRSVSRKHSAPVRDPMPTELPYVKQRFLFSKAEKSFYQVLLGAVPEGYVVFAKVRLADVVAVRSGTENRQAHLNRITAKHVDFVICDKQWLEPRLAIELDDSSHERADRQERDGFVEAACRAAGLPLYRVTARQTYSQTAIAQDIRNALGKPSPVQAAK